MIEIDLTKLTIYVYACGLTDCIVERDEAKSRSISASSIVISPRATVCLCSTLNSAYVYFTEFIEDTGSLGIMF